MTADQLMTPSCYNNKANLPGVVFRFDLSSNELIQLKNIIVSTVECQLEKIASLTRSECNFQSVFEILGTLENWSLTYVRNIAFLQHVHPDETIRQLSSDLSIELDRFALEMDTRSDIYQRVLWAADHTDITSLPYEDAKFITKTMHHYKQSGLHLSAEDLSKVKGLLADLANFKAQFEANVREDQTFIDLTKDELEGVPDYFLNTFPKKVIDNTEVYSVSLKDHHYSPLVTLCKISETRRKLKFARDTRCPQNLTLLKSILNIRSEVAQIKGYTSHADYRLEDKMAKNPVMVNSFLDGLRERVIPLAQKELQLVQTFKESVENSGPIQSWDLGYYFALYRRNNYCTANINSMEYFPLHHVTTKILEIYEKMLSLKLTLLDEDELHPSEIQVVQVEDQSTGNLMGYIYLDLVFREGKSNRSACFPLQTGPHVGAWDQVSVAAIVTNFTPASDAGTPLLLRHTEVETYFHELGHAMHHICSQTKWASMHGLSVQVDFVEVPSQMLENWCQDPATLSQLSAHYLTGEPIPQDEIVSLVRAEKFGNCLDLSEQIMYAQLDLNLHTSKWIDNELEIVEIGKSLQQSFGLVDFIQDTFWAATFGHIIQGYDCMYYGYLWSKVFSSDIFVSKFKDNAAQFSQVGLDYRLKVLSPGGTRDGMELLIDFLGREPNPEAFFTMIVVADS